LVDVSQIVEQMLELMKVSVSTHAVMEANLDKDLPPVRANAAQPRQIITNLITNAPEAIEDRDNPLATTLATLTATARGSQPR
jgi:nitrogen-specific signal transduction histidine kinase